MSIFPSDVWGEISQLLGFQKSIEQLNDPSANLGFKNGKIAFFKEIILYYQAFYPYNQENKHEAESAICNQFSLNPKNPSNKKVDQIFKRIWSSLVNMTHLEKGEISLDALESYHKELKQSTLVFWKLLIKQNSLSFHPIATLRPLEVQKMLQEWIQENESHLNSLSELTIPKNRQLTIIPPEIQKLTYLTRLFIHNPHIKSLHSIWALFNLRCLTIETALPTFPKSIEKLACLERLEIINSHQIRSLPESIGNLTKLKWLVIIYNKELRSLPDSMKYLLQLKRLDISHNDRLCSLPKDIGQLPNLNTITVSRFLPKSLANSVVLLSKQNIKIEQSL